MGTHTQTGRNEPHAQVLNLTTLIKHGRYTGIAMRYDIALVRLNQSLVMTDYVHPVCIPAFDVNRGTCFLTGWEVEDGLTELQHQVALQLLPNRVCNQPHFYDTMVSQRMRCAGRVDSNYSNPCLGDSGGPLVCEVGDGEFKVWELHGILSWSANCSEAYKPAVFIRLAPFRNWIIEQIRKYEAFRAVSAWMKFDDPFGTESADNAS